MPRNMPALGSEFRRQVDSAILIAKAGELARDALPARSAARGELRPSRLEAIYEMAYLRIFVMWEVFLEETLIRMMCLQRSPLCTPVPQVPGTRFPSLAAARAALYGGQRYLLWHDPGRVVARSRAWLHLGPHELVIASQSANLEWMASVRHRIAHGSDDARSKFDFASMQLAGRRYRGASAGRLLRDADPNSVAEERWLTILGRALGDLALQIAP